jgi:hypothetical protein
VDFVGDLVTLEEQDRSLWNQAQIAEGTAILARALRRRAVQQHSIRGRYAMADGNATDTLRARIPRHPECARSLYTLCLSNSWWPGETCCHDHRNPHVGAQRFHR